MFLHNAKWREYSKASVIQLVSTSVCLSHFDHYMCIFIKLGRHRVRGQMSRSYLINISTYVAHDERMDPSDFCGASEVKRHIEITSCALCPSVTHCFFFLLVSHAFHGILVSVPEPKVWVHYWDHALSVMSFFHWKFLFLNWLSLSVYHNNLVNLCSKLSLFSSSVNGKELKFLM